MRVLLAACILATIGLPSQAVAMCYTVFGPNAVVVWRSSSPPIDLSKPVSAGMQAAFPRGSILIISDDTRDCAPVGAPNSSAAMQGTFPEARPMLGGVNDPGPRR